MLVSCLDSCGNLLPGEHIVADAARAGVGDTVLVSADGSAAELEFQDDPCVLDGVIVGVIDSMKLD